MSPFQLINVSGTKSSYTNRNKELDASRNFAIYYDLQNNTLFFTPLTHNLLKLLSCTLAHTFFLVTRVCLHLPLGLHDHVG